MSEGYLMAGQHSELERLQLQARLWEPVGGRPSSDSETGGAGGRLMSAAARWAGCGSSASGSGREGEVVGSDIDDTLLGAARELVDAEGLANVDARD